MTFSLHKGLFRYKRLNFGVNSAAEIFQHTIHQLIADIDGAINIPDDVIIFSNTESEHLKIVQEVLKRFQ